MKGKAPMPLDQRLRARTVETADGCWEWIGRINPAGYGMIHVGSLADGTRRMEYVHRVAYLLFVGEIPDDCEIDHVCRNRRCLNPAHLEAVPHHENMRRSRRTHCRRGHEFTPENTVLQASGRTCRTCRQERDRARSPRMRGRMA